MQIVEYVIFIFCLIGCSYGAFNAGWNSCAKHVEKIIEENRSKFK